MNALPLRAPRGQPNASHKCATASLYEREDLNVQEKMSALSALPPPLSTIRNESFFRVDGGWRCWQAAKACILRFLAEDLDGRAITKNLQKRGLALPDRCTEVLYHTAVLAGDRVGRWGVSRILAHFSLYLVSHTDCGRDARVPRGDSPNLGCTLSLGVSRIHWRDLPDHWRLRPSRWVWPHLTDNQLACSHNNPGYTLACETVDIACRITVESGTAAPPPPIPVADSRR